VQLGWRGRDEDKLAVKLAPLASDTGIRRELPPLVGRRYVWQAVDVVRFG